MIGVLALQGAFQKHQECLEKLSVPSLQVRHPKDLEKCQGLIIPGGETTAHLKLLTEEFWIALSKFGLEKPIFGTCCGMILLSKEVVDSPIRVLGLMDIKTARNAYGSQICSFEMDVEACLDSNKTSIKGCFIRAPKVVSVGPEISVLGMHENVPVIVENKLHLATSYHPEISGDLQLHQYFLQKVQSQAVFTAQ